MPISRSPIPSWTTKERAFVTFAVVAAALAGYATVHLGWISYVALRRDWTETAETILALSGFGGFAIFVAALALMLKGLDAIQRERRKVEIEQRLRDDSAI